VTPAELALLSADRPLVTYELHESNDFYGHAALLKRYAGWPARSSLKLAIEHGIALHDTIWVNDLGTEMPLFLCAGAARAERYEREAGGRRRALPIGPMIHYAAALTPSDPPSGRRVLLVFPTHSSHRVKVRYDQAAFLTRLEALSREFDEVVVCIYWRDVLDGAARPYAERGYACVTAGHMFDPGFLPRLVKLLRDATLVYTNEVGSQILYATMLDRPSWVERGEIRYEAPPEVLREDVPDFLEHPYVTGLLGLFSTRSDTVTLAQRQFVKQLAGAAHLRSPAQLRSILADAEARYLAETPLPRRLKHLLRAANNLRRVALDLVRRKAA